VSSRRLVITADDLGRDPHTDATVLGLVAAGHVTATTLLTVAPGAADAAARVAALGLTPRLHATLTSERGLAPWPACSGNPALVTDAGALPFEMGLAPTAASVAALLGELAAQLAWLRDRGIAVTGADSHGGTLYGLDGGPWLAPVLRWCAAEHLAFRLPRSLTPYLGQVPAEIAARHRDAVALADQLGVPLPETMITNRATAAELGSYEALREHTIRALATLPVGTSELFLHPADDLPGATGQIRAWEAMLLRDPAWHDALASTAVETVPDWLDGDR
jgi:predicted glycoside hydrolase/deacetylase ChbG (UPF0249 family)